jgi:hypothetical protein
MFRYHTERLALAWSAETSIMRAVGFRAPRALLLILFAASHLTIAGCGDDSKTSGTMVQVSEEEKAYLAAKRESYKAAVPKTKSQAKTKTSPKK